MALEIIDIRIRKNNKIGCSRKHILCSSKFQVRSKMMLKISIARAQKLSLAFIAKCFHMEAIQTLHLQKSCHADVR